MLNFMNLCNLNLTIFINGLWNLVVIADWVMIGNIYGMYFNTNTMRKPYISSSSYIVNMSNYKKNGNWDKIWDRYFTIFYTLINLN